MGLAEQLTLLSRGNQPVAEYLAQVRDIADELALVGAPVPSQYLITRTLNGLGPAFKEISAAVRARDSVIGFDELHDKLVEYELFLKREEIRATGLLGAPPITVNAARSTSAGSSKKSNYNKNSSSAKSSSSTSNQWRHSGDSSAQHGSQNKQVIICQFCDKRGHSARQFYLAKKIFSQATPPTAHAATTSPPAPWLLNSGASHHVTTDLNNLTLGQTYDGPDDVVIGDGPLYESNTRNGAE